MSLSKNDFILVPSRNGAASSWPSPVEFAERLRAAVFTNALALVGESLLGDEDSESTVLHVNEALRRAGRHYELRVPPEGSAFAVLVLDHDRDDAVTEFGAFVPPHNGSRANTLVDLELLVERLSDLSFVESVFYKVRRLSVVSDLALYPYWLVGQRRFRPLTVLRPEVAIHYRFLETLDVRREARLYRAITPRWEVRRDKASGRRLWSGRLA